MKKNVGSRRYTGCLWCYVPAHRMKVRVWGRPGSVFFCGGILPPTSFKIVPYHNQPVIFFSLLFFFFFLDLGKLVTDSFPCKGIKAEISHYHLNASVCSLHLPSLVSREENQWYKHTLILPGDGKKPLGLFDKRFCFYSEIVLAFKNIYLKKKIQLQNTQAHIFWNTSFFICLFCLDFREVGGGHLYGCSI